MHIFLQNRMLSKPPMPTSTKLANEALRYIQQNPHGIFRPMNGPQLAAVGAALTRKLTMIQGKYLKRKSLRTLCWTDDFTQIQLSYSQFLQLQRNQGEEQY